MGKKVTWSSSPDDDYEWELMQRRRRLQEQLDLSRKKSSKEMSDIGFWGIFSGLAMAVDLVALGGFGTGVALFSTGLWANHRMDVGRLQKQLKETEDNLLDYQKIKLTLQPPAQPLPPAVKKAFDESAALKKRLAEVEKQMEDLKNPKRIRLDKNPPSPPSSQP